jgi:hypothetical protein
MAIIIPSNQPVLLCVKEGWALETRDLGKATDASMPKIWMRMGWGRHPGIGMRLCTLDPAHA